MTMINETQPTRYVIKLDGMILSIPFSTQGLAEQHVQTLPPEQRMRAQIVPVVENANGPPQEILLG